MNVNAMKYLPVKASLFVASMPLITQQLFTFGCDHGELECVGKLAL
jgi:hypothetical protein